MYARADRMFSPDGMIGGPLTHIEDAIRHRADALVVFPYEALVRDPARAMRELYSELRLDWFEHDFENVENRATDLDALALFKYPHSGSGKVADRGDTWREVVAPDVARAIIERYPVFAEAFRYR